MNRPNLRGPIGRVAGQARARNLAALDEAAIGRIERWVVGALDGHAAPTPDRDWRESLEDFFPAKRPVAEGRGETQANASTPTPTPGGWARFRLARRRGVAVVSLADQSLTRDDELAELQGDLLALVEAGHLRIVLDFFAVERLSSWAASALDRIARACFAAPGGALKFSGLRPDVAAIFAMTGLDPRVATYPDTASAVAGIWPDSPALRPLPVSILSALMRAEDARPPRPEPKGPEEFRAMTTARLVVQDGPDLGRTVAIQGDRFLIGRGPDCQLRLGSLAVSRSHARIERKGDRYYLRDLSSTNGSLLNGKPLRDRVVEIRDGDRLRFGPLTFALALTLGKAPSRLARVDFGLEDDATDATEEFPELDGPIDLKHEVIEGVLVVTPQVPDLDAEEAVDAFRDALLALARRRYSSRVVVNLTHVGHLSGRAIGTLIAHHLRLDRTGGALRVCLANPRVALILEQVKLGMLVDCHPTIEEAVLAAWPEPAEATPQGTTRPADSKRTG